MSRARLHSPEKATETRGTRERNKHFYRGVFEVAFGEYREETTERVRELAERDTDHWITES